MDREKERAIEWECQKVLRQYYQHVDRREFEKAVALFTPGRRLGGAWRAPAGT